MRPISLHLKAFGPFGGAAHVDFDRLSRDQVFLIHGRTGAGKTTLLDGICFALYGATSGGERSGREMRSHQASPRTSTEVSYVFDVSGRRYRVSRRPEQEKPRSRGDGVTLQKGQVTLEVRSSDLARDEAATAGASQQSLDLGLEGWTTLATKTTDVDAAVVDLLGLTVDQFRQVVVLPQGRFREFLLASSRERQAILESLFGTERFRRLEEALKAEAQRLQNAIAGEHHKRTMLIEQAGLDAAECPIAARDATAEELAQQRRVIAELEGALRERREAHERAREAAAKLKELADARAACQSVERERGEQARRVTRLERARRAIELTAVADRAAESRKALTEVEERQAALEAALGEQRQRRADRHAAVALERERRQDREAAAEKRRALRAFEARAVELEAARQARRVAETSRGEALSALSSAERDVVELEKARVSAQQSLDHARLLAAKLEGRRAGYVEKLKLRQSVLRLSELEVEAEKSRTRLEQARQQERGLADLVERALSARDSAEHAWQAGQAAELARGLKEGDACPVCGATDHPAPASTHRRSPDEITVRRVRELRAEAEKQRLALEELRRVVVGAEGDLGSLTKEAALLQAQLAERGLTADRKIDEDVDRAHALLEEAEAAYDGLESGRAGVIELDEQLSDARRAVVEHRARADRQVAEAERLKAVVSERSEGLPEDLLDEGALQKALTDADRRVTELESALSSAEAALASADRELFAAERAFADGAEELKGRAANRGAAERALLTALQTAGFDDEGAWASARLPPPELAELETQVTAFEQRASAVGDRLGRAEAQATDLSPPDVDALAANEQRAATALSEATRALGELEARHRQLVRLCEGLDAASSKERGLDTRYQVLGRLAEVASGENPRRTTFHRYVLATLLDDVLDTASRRLLTMSRGRYRLLRAQQKVAGRRRAQGLELMVHDEHSGTERPVSTLSGGESFLAALSLALGLHEAAQARAGGRELGAIFIDEGFGGLDPEALDLALDALSQLRAGGRLVGLISHVAELKERVEQRVEVVPGRRGSRLLL